MVAFNKYCHILAFSLVFCLFLPDATSITVGQVVIQIKNQNSQNLCGLHSSADFIFFFSQKLRITFECGLNSSAGCFRVNWVYESEWSVRTKVRPVEALFLSIVPRQKTIFNQYGEQNRPRVHK